MKINSKLLPLIFVFALISTPKAESKITLNGLLATGNILISAYDCYNLCQNLGDITSSLQALVGMSTFCCFHNNTYKNFNTKANVIFFIYFLTKALIAEKTQRNSEKISKERINSLIMAAFYGFTAYQLNK